MRRTRMRRYIKKRRKPDTISILQGKSLSRVNGSSYLTPRLKLFPRKLKSRWSGEFTVTQVFPYGGAKIMHLEKGTFKVNTQQLKPYFGGEFHASKQAIHPSTPKIVP